jgi:hypothetical protein
MQIVKAGIYSGGSPMKYTVTVEVLKMRYERKYDSDAGPKEILERIRDAVEAEPALLYHESA